MKKNPSCDCRIETVEQGKSSLECEGEDRMEFTG